MLFKKKDQTSSVKEEKPNEKKKIDFKLLIRNRIFLATSAIVLSGILVFGGTFLMDKLLNSTVSVVKAKEDISKGTRITENMITYAEVGKLGLSEDTILDASQVVGKYAAVDMYQSDVLRSSKTTVTVPFDFPYLHVLRDGELAVAVSLNSVAAGLSAKVRAGDVVSIYGTPIEEEPKGNSFFAYAPEELEYVRVLAVSGENGIDITESNQYVEDKLNTPITITLLVNQTQAALLAGLEQKSRIHLALATREKEKAEYLLQQQAEFFQKDENIQPIDNTRVEYEKSAEQEDEVRE